MKSSGIFNWSTWITSFTIPGCGATTTAPGAPSNLQATAGDSRVDLTWTAPTTGSAPTSYTIQRSTTSGAETTVGSTSGTSYPDTGLANGTTYYYRVLAVNSAGSSAASNEVSATPTGPPPAPVASFSYSCGGATCSFNGSASTNTTAWDWNYGDGTLHGSGSTSSHTYAAPGSFTVILSVTGPGGGPSTTNRSLTCTNGKGKNNKLSCR